MALPLVVAVFACGTPAAAETSAAGTSFRPELVRETARQLAAHPYVAPERAAPPPLDAIGYDQWRDIRHIPNRALWHDQGLGFEAQFFVASFIYQLPVELFEVHNGTVAAILPDRGLFDLGPLSVLLPDAAQLRYSGFRLHGPLKRSDRLDEIIAFQGASYFRALGRDHTYGLSARGLAIDTVSTVPEEFPRFRSFWIERPEAPSLIRIHALLDSGSVTGAYHFTLRPGQSTVMDVEAHLFPRQALTNVGVAPLTSMFLFNTVNRASARDFRSAVHDSDGLAVLTGANERLWRPLNKHRQSQVSAFLDYNPRGFGLIQRQRSFAAYQDLEARYERRPSAWVEPIGDWGEGAVELVELSTGGEYDDNIVAFWRPAQALQRGHAYMYQYRLHWADDVPLTTAQARVLSTRVGVDSRSDASLFVIDFEGLPEPGRSAVDLERAAAELPTPVIEASAGAVRGQDLRVNPETGGLRLSFYFEPRNAPLSELRAQLRRNETPISETWLYRWTADRPPAATSTHVAKQVITTSPQDPKPSIRETPSRASKRRRAF